MDTHTILDVNRERLRGTEGRTETTKVEGKQSKK